MNILNLKYFRTKFSEEDFKFYLIQKGAVIEDNHLIEFKDELEFCETFILTMNEKIRNYE